MTDDVISPGDSVELHLHPVLGTRLKTLGRGITAQMGVRSREAAERKTRYEWGASWEDLGCEKAKVALVDIVVRDDDGEGVLWSLCLTGGALRRYDPRCFAEVEFRE